MQRASLLEKNRANERAGSKANDNSNNYSTSNAVLVRARTCSNVNDLAATVVAKQFPTSFAPIPKAIKKANITPAMAIQYNSGYGESSGGGINDMMNGWMDEWMDG